MIKVKVLYETIEQTYCGYDSDPHPDRQIHGTFKKVQDLNLDAVGLGHRTFVKGQLLPITCDVVCYLYKGEDVLHNGYGAICNAIEYNILKITVVGSNDSSDESSDED